MKRVLVTGMSGTGKSSVLARLAELGYKTVDTDDGWVEELWTKEFDLGDGPERLWREDRIQALLSTEDSDVLFISGVVRNQSMFYPRFDHIVLLSAPADVLVERLTTRTNNPYGKDPQQLADTLQNLELVEPMLRRIATLEIDTRAPLKDVVATILDHIRT